MRKAATLLLPVLIGTLWFNFLFWEEKLGLNALLFSLFFIGVLWWIYPDARKSRAFLLTAVGALLSAGMVVWHNSAAAKIANIISVMCAAGFAQEPTISYLLNALWQYLSGWLQTPGHLIDAINTGESGTGKGKRIVRSIGLAIIPFCVALVFYLLYYAANDNFAKLADKFWAQVGRIFTFDISLPHLLFVVFAFFICGAAFWPNKTGLAEKEVRTPDQLSHIRPPRKRYIESRFMMGLKREFLQSGILLWMLNGLLLLVNLTDVWYVWFGFDESAMQDLKGYVHEGTYILIFSILLAMGVLFYVFRKNINFFPENSRLKTAATLWLIQNGILALSVGVRNARYVEFHGLAYKRIGVFLFLMLVFYGLYTLYIKIMERKSMFWLWRQNGWAFYFLLCLNSVIAWDPFITKYNLSSAPKGPIDVRFMIYEMSDLNIYLLENNAEALISKDMYPRMAESEIRNGILEKRRYFEEKMAKYTWKSWNLGDMANARE